VGQEARAGPGATGTAISSMGSGPARAWTPSRSMIDRWRTDRPESKRQYDIAVQLRTDGLLEETIDIIDDKKEMVTETVSENEDGTKSVSKAFATADALC
jgi:hypothetical protein